MNKDLKGKTYPIVTYEVGREKIFEYARATLSTNPYCTDPEFAARSHYGAVVAPPTFAAVYCHNAMRMVFDDQELGMNIPRVVHGEQTFEFGEVVKLHQRFLPISLKNASTASTNASGCSICGKCPARGIPA